MPAKTRFHEKVTRSIVKAITFRLLVVASDSIVVYLLTHRIDMTFGVVFMTNVASSLLYFFHERAWNSVHWGKEKK